MKFSLVIPVALYRDAEILKSIEKLEISKKDYEVIVERGTNPSENRNKGFEKSKGKIIVFLDDDAILEKDYLTKVDEFLEKHPEIDVVGGPQLSPKDEKGFAKISGYALASKFGAWKLSNRYTSQKEVLDVDETSLTSANLICKRKVMEKIKFSPDLFPGEDPKFISDVKREGFKVAYSPEIILYHRRRATVEELIKQIYKYGKARPAKESLKETIKKPFFLVPSLFVIYLISLVILPLVVYTKGTLLLPLFIYIILIIFFAFYDSIKNKDVISLFVLPFIYPMIHISYGIGMIAGYLKKL
jgi:GT2 family glycosyltransferase